MGQSLASPRAELASNQEAWPARDVPQSVRGASCQVIEAHLGVTVLLALADSTSGHMVCLRFPAVVGSRYLGVVRSQYLRTPSVQTAIVERTFPPIAISLASRDRSSTRDSSPGGSVGLAANRWH